MDTPDSVYTTVALRAALVSKLTGLSIPKLRYWHETTLQPAHREPGAPGVPRLYSWIDYQRLCLISGLVDQGVSTRRIRSAVAYLDELFPDWYTRSLMQAQERDRIWPESSKRRHIIADARAQYAVLADASGQDSFRPQLAERGEGVTSELVDEVETGLGQLAQLGTLYKLNRFSDAVAMSPLINVGLPTLKRSRLETSFIYEVARDLRSPEEVARIYRLDERRVRRAIEFEEAAA